MEFPESIVRKGVAFYGGRKQRRQLGKPFAANCLTARTCRLTARQSTSGLSVESQSTTRPRPRSPIANERQATPKNDNYNPQDAAPFEAAGPPNAATGQRGLNSPD